MIAYNTTFVVHPSCEQVFLDYLRAEYIPMLGQMPLNLSLKRVQAHEEEADSVSLALSFDTLDEESLIAFLSTTGKEAADHLTARFGESVLGFSTVMHHLSL